MLSAGMLKPAKGEEEGAEPDGVLREEIERSGISPLLVIEGIGI